MFPTRPVLLSLSLAFLTLTFLTVPSAHNPCACVDLGSGQEQARTTQGTQTSSQETPSSGSNAAVSSEQPGPASGETGSELESGLEGERYGNQINSTQDKRIDGFRELPWGSSPSEVEKNMGAPVSRSAREDAPYYEVGFPDEGKKVWAYEQEILDRKAYIYVAFDQIHVANDWGLIWAATLWTWENLGSDKDSRQKNFRRITSELGEKILTPKYGKPAITQQDDYSESEKPKFWNLSWANIWMWEDDYGRVHQIQDKGDGILAYYQSQALIEKRNAEVEEAESKF